MHGERHEDMKRCLVNVRIEFALMLLLIMLLMATTVLSSARSQHCLTFDLA